MPAFSPLPPDRRDEGSLTLHPKAPTGQSPLVSDEE